MFDLHEVYRLSPIEEIIADCEQGRMVILVDDESRENEGDLVIPAACADAAAVNFMARYGRGLICMAIPPHRAEQFSLGPMTAFNTDPHHTAFTISVDAKEGTTTGISASDRARTIALLASDGGCSTDLVSPGHLFPLVAQPDGVLQREGHTEAAVDLARLSGQGDSGVICEIMNDEGEMARLPDLLEFGARHGLKVGSIEDLKRYRRALLADKAA